MCEEGGTLHEHVCWPLLSSAHSVTLVCHLEGCGNLKFIGFSENRLNAKVSPDVWPQFLGIIGTGQTTARALNPSCWGRSHQHKFEPQVCEMPCFLDEGKEGRKEIVNECEWFGMSRLFGLGFRFSALHAMFPYLQLRWFMMVQPFAVQV